MECLECGEDPGRAHFVNTRGESAEVDPERAHLGTKNRLFLFLGDNHGKRFLLDNASLSFGRTSAGIECCFFGGFLTLSAHFSFVYSLIMNFVTDGWASTVCALT